MEERILRRMGGMVQRLTAIVAAIGFAYGESKPLNLILIIADDLGHETLGCNGGESYQTPNLDKLAAEGIRFEHCYSQPICTPTRVQIMTGLYNDRNYTKFGQLRRGETTFAHLLKEKGYSTAIAGKWQLGKEKDSPQHFGFEKSLLWQHTRSGRMPKPKGEGKGVYDKRFENPYLERNGVEEDYTNGEYAPDLCTDFLCKFIDENKKTPFLVYYPMILTHCPFWPVPGGKDWDPKSPGSPTYKGDPKYFGDMVNYMDKLVGRIVAQVEKSGLSENTVIIFTGDNGTDKPVVSKWRGIEVAGSKGKTIDDGCRVPLIVRAPGLKGRGECKDLVDFTDLLPTLCDLAAVDPGKQEKPFDGQSFAPQIRGEKGTARDHTFCWYSRSGNYKKDLAVFARTERYKLYRDGRFFDLPQDRLEKNELKGEILTDEQKKVKAMLQAVLDERLKEVGR
ncbi:MAG: sulfatase-like hydrolase/transferase [Akkermansiaceae bacterium]